MTQEQKDLLLKDLSSRLPYGVNCKIYHKYRYYDMKLSGVFDNEAYFTDDNGSLYIDYENIKPYLFPLSSMTEEQYDEMQSISGKDCLEHMEVEKEWINNSVFSHLPLYEYRVIDFFNKNHFDYRGLIPMGLAIDATDKNIY